MSECLVYRGIRYASAHRFAPAAVLPFIEAELSRGRGPIPPQPVSRLAAVLGPQADLEWSEDCQVLSIFTPNLSGNKPVMIWFHGGAFITGGGELPWYDGDRLASEQDVVVVTVSYRLGALGHLLIDEKDTPSPATSDQLAAIDWVHANIAQFGGDPENITLFGHSAGAASIDTLFRWGLGPHVKGAILQSGFLSEDGIQIRRDQALERSALFAQRLNKDLYSASLDEIVDLQGVLAGESSASTYWAPVLPKVSAEIHRPILAGSTKHDALPFVLTGEDRIVPEPRDFSERADEIEQLNQTMIEAGNLRLANEVSMSGYKSWLYMLSFEVPSSGWGAPHGIELPYLLGTQQAWSAAPMMQGADWDHVNSIGAYLRSVWGAFARDQIPSSWVEHTPLAYSYTTVQSPIFEGSSSPSKSSSS